MWLALDWAKAFDSIRPEALLTALRRFGVPEPFSQMVPNIYQNRTFLVQDAGARSRLHSQNAGVCQGCPVSPLLFVIVMTVLIHDARAELHPAAARRVLEHAHVARVCAVAVVVRRADRHASAVG